MPSRSRLLRNRDLAAVLSALPDLYAPLGQDSWQGRVIRAVERLVPARVSYNIVDLRSDNARYADDTGFHEIPELGRLVHADPRLRKIRQKFDHTPTLFTDHLSTGEIRRSEIYNQYYRQLGVLHQMCVAVHRSPEHLFFVGLTRRENFSERERNLVATLQPHLARAMLQLVPPVQWHQMLVSAPRTNNDPPLASLSSLRELGLTPRQAEVLYWISQGKRDSEIAVILGASVRTIHHHVEAVLRRLQVENRQSAMLRAVAMLSTALGTAQAAFIALT